jgi:hypothetical protein
MILQICLAQVDEYNFRLWNVTSQEAYDNAQIDWATFTNVSLKFYRVNEPDEAITLDISDRYQYLFDCVGRLVINFEDFGVETFNGFNYFPDWLYTAEISYTYNAVEYTASVTTGFRRLISRLVYQSTQQSHWKKELACTCDCENYSSILRKWNFLQLMGIAAELCLINEWFAMLKSLYKLMNTEHEFADQL